MKHELTGESPDDNSQGLDKVDYDLQELQALLIFDPRICRDEQHLTQ